MVEEATVYCGSCGGALLATARFCRACGASQEEFATQEADAPPSPGAAPGPFLATAPSPQPNSLVDQRLVPQSQLGAPSVAAPQSRSSAVTTAAVVAIAGGIGICFMVLYAVAYVPLNHHFSFAFGEPLEFGDILAFGAGLLAICLGTRAFMRAPANPGRSGALLMVTGVLPIVLVVVWALPETLHLDYYFSRPFYFGFVYFCELGKAHIGGGYVNGYVQVPLLVSSALVLLAGCTMAFARRQRAIGPSWQ
jgi:hypothetical protein